MKVWTDLVIDVDYHPCDPGMSQWYCERTEYAKADLKAGMPLPYKDPGDLLAGISVAEVSDSRIILSCGGRLYTLEEGHSHALLDKGGRDYTEFELNVSLRMVSRIENNLDFFRQFYTGDQVSRISEPDLRQYRESADPCAKYALGRWHYIMAPDGEESLELARKLFREAAEAGIADAYAVLSSMYFQGETEEDRVDFEEGERLRGKALAMGSELAALRYARQRVTGLYQTPEEPLAVAEESERRLREEPDASPQWYSVLGFAFEVLGRPEAGQVYEEGIRKGCLRCYSDLATWYRAQGNEEEYVRWMEAGMKKGCGLCYLLGCDFPVEEFEKMDSRRRLFFSKQARQRLEDGLEHGEANCAFWLGLNYYYGTLGFPSSSKQAADYLTRGMDMGDASCFSFTADILESEDPSEDDIRDAARLRLRSLRLGNESVREEVLEAYRAGLLQAYEDEIEQYWLPEEPDGDDGHWDAYV